eukprot:102947-Amphidinium_carterae.1
MQSVGAADSPENAFMRHAVGLEARVPGSRLQNNSDRLEASESCFPTRDTKVLTYTHAHNAQAVVGLVDLMSDVVGSHATTLFVQMGCKPCIQRLL